MASSMTVPRPPAAPPDAAEPAAAQPVARQPKPARSTAALRDQRYRIMQIALFTAGALLMPAGIVAIILGWYGVAHTKYQYNQLPYVVSGGLIGLALVFLGGFLYFGAWLAKMANDQRESARQLADTMLVLADLVSRRSGVGEGAAADTTGESGAMPVLAGAGSTVHRRDCPLIAHRTDLHVITGHETGLGTCRVCRPTLI